MTVTPPYEPFNFIYVIMFVLPAIVFCLGIWLSCKDKAKSAETVQGKRWVKAYHLILGIIIITIIWLSIKAEVLYPIDYRFNLVNETEQIIVSVDGNSYRYAIWDSNRRKYYIFRNEKNANRAYREALEENFEFANCEIEYYKLSRVIKEIRVIE